MRAELYFGMVFRYEPETRWFRRHVLRRRNRRVVFFAGPLDAFDLQVTLNQVTNATFTTPTRRAVGSLADVTVPLAILIGFGLLGFCWFAARRSSYHRGKSDAFRQVANEFQGLYDCTWWRDSRRAEQAAERKKRMLNLCLCDPRVCDALAEALTEAREFWEHPTPTPDGEPQKPSQRA